MARGFGFSRIVAVVSILCIALAACDGGGTTERVVTSAAQGDSPEEVALRRAAKAMQRTILEGAAAGGAAGGLLGLTFGNDSDDVGSGVSIGIGAGTAAGTYVAFVQRKFVRRARRLKQVQDDLDRNAQEMQATLAAMNAALRVQQQELTAVRLQAAQGSAAPEDLARETAEAQSNLSQMQLAIDGATKRQEEFIAARSLTKRRNQDTAPIDPELQAMANRIAEMKAVANDLAQEL